MPGRRVQSRVRSFVTAERGLPRFAVSRRLLQDRSALAPDVSYHSEFDQETLCFFVHECKLRVPKECRAHKTLPVLGNHLLVNNIKKLVKEEGTLRRIA